MSRGVAWNLCGRWWVEYRDVVVVVVLQCRALYVLVVLGGLHIDVVLFCMSSFTVSNWGRAYIRCALDCMRTRTQTIITSRLAQLGYSSKRMFKLSLKTINDVRSIARETSIGHCAVHTALNRSTDKLASQLCYVCVFNDVCAGTHRESLSIFQRQKLE